jgi:hypothetical protein
MRSSNEPRYNAIFETAIIARLFYLPKLSNHGQQNLRTPVGTTAVRNRRRSEPPHSRSEFQKMPIEPKNAGYRMPR